LVPGLTQADFEVLEDGVLQKIQFFAREPELPLRVGLIVDGSGSQSKFVRRHEHDLKVFLESILRPDDEALALGFDLLRVDAKDAFEQISEQLRSMYEIAYVSSNAQDGSYHKITIRVKREGITVRAKTGYYAK
jgi:hypothetical protein